jgi:CHASE2 domain-containing sensor protein
MFIAQQELQQASLMHDALASQLMVTQLHTQNLNSLGTTAALIAGMAFIGVTNAYIAPVIKNTPLAYIYCSLFAISLIASLSMVCRGIIASMLGPIKALLGPN